MNVLIIPDVPFWAIGKLTGAIQMHNKDMNIKVEFVHPRDAETPDAISRVKSHLEWADVIHFQYWNTAQQLIKKIPELKNKTTILTHHNQKNLLSEDWHTLGINYHVCHTQKAYKTLIQAGYKKTFIIQHGIDLRYFEFNDNLPFEIEDKRFGYVGRITPWKGLKEIAESAREIGIPLLMMGKQDKADYWMSINTEDKENMDWEFFDCEDAERVNAYYKMSVYVGNSGDGREEGPLGLLEAMACGVPVVTTPSGEAADICQDEYNALVVPFEDKNALKKAMLRLINDKELANKLRNNAWNTVKNMTEKKMAYEYKKLYFKAFHKDNPIVSVIVPYTEDRKDYVEQIKEAYKNQTYKHIEVITVEDTESGYNLAKCRNLGALDAIGEILLFNDSRLLPETDAVQKFIEKFEEVGNDKVWFFGEKGGNKSNFVENFSAIRRDYYIKGGMSNERITRYGAMSQELRERFTWNSFRFEYVPEAKCKQLCSTHKTKERRQDIIESKFQLFKMGL